MSKWTLKYIKKDILTNEMTGTENYTQTVLVGVLNCNLLISLPLALGQNLV